MSCTVRNIHTVKYLIHTLLAVGTLNAHIHKRKFDILEYCHLINEIERLEHKTEFAFAELCALPLLEPTGNLDSKNGQEVMHLLQELNRDGTTIIMVTHSQRDAQYASRTICLFDGQIVTDVANKL